jgi:hypothetical protein
MEKVQKNSVNSVLRYVLGSYVVRIKDGWNWLRILSSGF